MLYAKLAGAGSIALIIFFGYLYVTDLQESNAQLEKDNATLQISVESFQRLNEQINQEVEDSKINLAEVYKKFDKAEEEKKRLVKLFSNHDFANLLAKKPGLITKRMIAATEKRFKEIEDEINN